MPPLSEAQREIMELIWDQGELAAAEVREILAQRRDVARETVRTLMARMEEKGWLKHRVIGRTFFYSPAVPREAKLGQRVLDLLEQLCGGSPERLVNALIEVRGLTAGEADRIEKLIAEARKAKKRPRR